jgi:two-component system, chemotaxis family, protein-glutamate methylesterase/glutaminase
LDGRDVVVIGASSGGVEALMELAGGLPSDLPAAVFVVVHVSEAAPSILPYLLDRAGPLRGVNPEDGDPIEAGRIFVAPPDHHLLLERGRVRVTRGPRENRHRPAVDPLFRSAALAYGPRVVGAVLSGARDDGTAGLWAVKRRGGVAVIQDPDDALFADMPRHAMEYVDVDHCVPLEKMAPLLDRLCREPAEPTVERGAYGGVTDDMEFEAKIAGLDPGAVEGGEHPGELVDFTCPECAGPLYEINEGDLVRFRCRVGHAYTAEDALNGKLEALEAALYAALNTLEESAEMADRLAARALQHGNGYAASRFEGRAQYARQQAGTIRAVLVNEALGPSSDIG